MRLYPLWLLPVVLSVGCKKEATAETIPDNLRGTYGRTADDLFNGTKGLEIGETTLKLSEMTITIKEGKVVGDDYQVALAEVTWKQDADKVPPKCKGTIARNDEHLLLRLFELESERPCESILEGDWVAWKPATEFPEPMRSWYGSAWTYSSAQGFEIGDTAIVTTEGGAFDLEAGWVWEGRDDELIVEAIDIEGTTCRGPMTVKEGRLSSDLSPADGGDGRCPRFSGERWTVDEAKLPKQPLTNGKVEISVADGFAKIVSLTDPKLTCTQRVLRTQARAATDRGRDDIPVLSGVVLALKDDEPEGDADGCSAAVKQLDVTTCTERLGPFCDQELLDGLSAEDRVVNAHCPTHIVIGDPETKGARVALLPVRDTVNLVCFEMTEMFSPKP